MAGWFHAEPPEHQGGNEASKNQAVDGATQANNIHFWLGQSANLRRNLETAQWEVDNQVIGSPILTLTYWPRGS
jgi:hypothetical protein